MDKRYKPLTPQEQLHVREALTAAIRAHPEWTVAQVVRHIRITLHLTVEELAKVGRISGQALRNIEAGRNSPTLDTAGRLLHPFGLRLSVTTMQDRFDARCQRIEAGFAKLPEAEGFAEIEAAIALDRAQVPTSTKKR